MPKFGRKSKTQLKSAHPELQRLFNEVIKHYDCSVLIGFRSQFKQDQAYKQGRSKVQWPDGKHNQQPSMAVDVAFYPIDWEDTKKWYHFGGFVMATAKQLDIPIRWGGNWDRDSDLKDQNFNDLPHFELVEEELKKPEKQIKEKDKTNNIIEKQSFFEAIINIIFTKK